MNSGFFFFCFLIKRGYYSSQLDDSLHGGDDEAVCYTSLSEFDARHVH